MRSSDRQNKANNNASNYEFHCTAHDTVFPKTLLLYSAKLTLLTSYTISTFDFHQRQLTHRSIFTPFLNNRAVKNRPSYATIMSSVFHVIDNDLHIDMDTPASSTAGGNDRTGCGCCDSCTFYPHRSPPISARSASIWYTLFLAYQTQGYSHSTSKTIQVLLKVTSESTAQSIAQNIRDLIQEHMPLPHHFDRSEGYSKIVWKCVGTIDHLDETQKMHIQISQIGEYLYELSGDFDFRRAPRSVIPDFWGHGNRIGVRAAF